MSVVTAKPILRQGATPAFFNWLFSIMRRCSDAFKYSRCTERANLFLSTGLMNMIFLLLEL